ncbi:copper resistance system multicopper oxidase [Acinetobacter nectaris]|nr:copper resistance system multicopper oxidase [Acinetobacter nectaris]MCF9034779.1 copper resistance system multicopper oxidase [Acinetobacter nectaris]
MLRQLFRLSIIGLCGVLSQFSVAAIKEYHLDINEQSVNLTGKAVPKITVNGQFPAPNLTFTEGDEAVIHVHNSLKNEPTSVHWHGILLPNAMDGVPGLGGFKEIQPNGDFTYRFKLRQSGTYWYHAHSDGQEQDGLYGAFVVYPKDNEPLTTTEKVQQDYVVMLSDFHTSSSKTIMKNLKKSPDYYQNQRETMTDVLHQVQQQGIKATWQDRKMWNQMRMLKTDLSDVTGYTFLMNGKTPQQNWTGLFEQGNRIRLRFINASAMSFFDVRIPNLKMTVVSADGQPVKPVNVDEFRFGAGETYDVIVEPKEDNYQIQAESIDRTGFAIGNLHNQASKLADFVMPNHRPRALLNMQDMGMSHDEMDISQQNMAGMEHSKHDMKDMDMSEHSMKGMDMPNDAMGQMDMSEHQMHMSHMNMSSHEMQGMNMPENASSDMVKYDPADGWDNASTPKGLKMLQYQDLQSLMPQKDQRPADKTIVMNLDGNMERYIWEINGKKYSQATPFKVKYGERVRLTFVNNTMMAHPMHLHGMFFQLENGQAMQNMPSKHTVIVPPGKTVSVLLTADEAGEWALHCHLLYHMTAGMMNTLIVATPDKSSPSQVIEPPVKPVQKEQHQHHADMDMSDMMSMPMGGHHAHH